MRKFIFILAPIIVIGASTLMLAQRQNDQHISAATDKTEQGILSPSPIPSDTPIPTSTSISEVVNNETSGLHDALVKEYGARASFNVEKSIGDYAQGSLKGKQNKWWLAKNTNNTWRIVADGYSYVSCTDIAPFNFPRSIVPMCWGNNTLVYR